MVVLLFFAILIGLYLIPTPSADDQHNAYEARKAAREKKLQELSPRGRAEEIAKEERSETRIIIFWCIVGFILIVFGSGSLTQCTDIRTPREEYEDQRRWEGTRR